MSFTLRKHQQEAIDEIQASISFGSRKVIADLPTSFGKSAVLAGLAKELPGKVAIVVTFTPLIEQIADHLEKMNVDYSILKAGMDDKFDKNKRVQLVMKQTYHARKDKLNMQVDYMLKDEVHVEWFGQKRMDEVYVALGTPVIIGVSGTPWDSKGYMLKEADDYIRTKTISQLTDEGFLSPVKYFIPKWAEEIDYTEVSIKGGDYTEKDIDTIVLEDAYMDAAIESMMQMGISEKKTIVFTNSIAHADLTAACLREKGVKAMPFHSKQDKGLSDLILEAFKTNIPQEIGKDGLFGSNATLECKVIVAVNKISIGFDAPDIQLGVMMRKTAVRSLFYQQVGRLIRTNPGKEYAELLDLANNTATFGFHDEQYSPPAHGEKQKLSTEEEKHSAREISLIADDEPTEITRELVLLKIDELERKKQDIPTINIGDLIAIYNNAQTPLLILRIAHEIQKRKTGQIYAKGNVEWISDEWDIMLEDFPQYKSRLLKTLRTMAKNKVAQGKKLAALHYTVKEDVKGEPGWLRQQTPYRDYIQPDSVEPTDEVVNNYYNTYDLDIDESQIPF